jgi:hypothetical protein
MKKENEIGYILVDENGDETFIKFKPQMNFGSNDNILQTIRRKDVNDVQLHENALITAKFEITKPCMNCKPMFVNLEGKIVYSEVYSAYVLKCDAGEIFLYKLSNIRKVGVDI